MDEKHEKQNKILAFKKQQKQTRKSSKIKKAVSIILTVCIVLALWVCRKQILSDILYERLQIMLSETASGEGYPFALQGNTVLKDNFAVSRRNAVILSDTSLNVVSKKGNVIISAQHNYVSPVLEESSSRFLIYDLGNKKYRIESISGTKIQAETDDKILAASIADSGKYAVATFAENYASAFKVYTPENKLQYEYSFASGYVTSMDIDENGTKGVVTTTYSKNGKIASAIYLFDFEKTEPIAVYEYEDILFVSSSYSDGKVVCVSDERFVFVNEEEQTKNEIDMQDNLLNAYDSYKGTLVAAYGAYSGAAENYLKVYDALGKEKYVLTFDEKILDTAVFGNTFAVLFGGKIEAYDMDTGSFIGQYDADADAVGIELASAEELYVLGFSEVSRIKIN